MPNFLQRARSAFGAMGGQQKQSVSPFKEAGTGGTNLYGGYVGVDYRSSWKYRGTHRYQSIHEMLQTTSIVAASVRYFLNLVAKSEWTVEPAHDLGEDESSDAAKQAAEFVESVMYDMATSWVKIVRRTGMFRFHGFGIQEWTAKRRDDGLIGFKDLAVRPQHTIQRWEVTDVGEVLGMWQQSPVTGTELFIPRAKTVYLHDDLLTDSPEGFGLFEHLFEHAERSKIYQILEGQGFERDLRGIPVGYAPYTQIREAVKAGKMTKEEGEQITDSLEKFVRLQAKAKNTGLVMDSAVYENQTADGQAHSNAKKWGIDLITGDANGIEALGKAIDRVDRAMARIIGTEQMMLGDGSGGNRALAEDKSKNLFLQAESTQGDIAEGFERDFVGPLWVLNGLPDKIKPTLKTEGLQFRDVEAIAATLRDMATAGAVLAPDDPAIDDVRDLLGVARPPELTPEMRGALTKPKGAPAADSKEEEPV